MTSTPSLAAGWIVAAHGGRSLAGRLHRLVVRDDGTGLAAGVVDRLAVDDGVAARLAPSADHHRDDDIEIQLRTTGPGLVQISARWTEPGACPLADLADSVLAVVTRRLLELDDRHTRLHGGAAVADGRAVVVIGASGAGKSTLVAHLVADGRAELVTDEQVALLPEVGAVGGFTRPVAVKRPGFAFLPAVGAEVASAVDPVASGALLTTADLGTTYALGGRPKLVVVPHRDHEADAPTWTEATPSEAIELLATHNLDLTARPRLALEAYAWLAATAPVVHLRYRDAADAAPLVLRLLADPPPAPDTTWSVDETATIAGRVGDRPPGVAPRPGVVTLTTGDQALLFLPRTRGLARLNAAGAALWAALPRPDVPLDGPDADFVADLATKGFVEVRGRRAD